MTNKNKYELYFNDKFSFSSDNAEVILNRYIAKKITHPLFNWEIRRGIN